MSLLSNSKSHISRLLYAGTIMALYKTSNRANEKGIPLFFKNDFAYFLSYIVWHKAIQPIVVPKNKTIFLFFSGGLKRLSLLKMGIFTNIYFTTHHIKSALEYLLP